MIAILVSSHVSVHLRVPEPDLPHWLALVNIVDVYCETAHHRVNFLDLFVCLILIFAVSLHRLLMLLELPSVVEEISSLSRFRDRFKFHFYDCSIGLFCFQFPIFPL